MLIFSCIFYFSSTNPVNFFFSNYNYNYLPKRFQKIVINKSTFVHKKSKERFIFSSPFYLKYSAPFFSNFFMLDLFVRSVIIFFYQNYPTHHLILKKFSFYYINKLLFYYLGV